MTLSAAAAVSCLYGTGYSSLEHGLSTALSSSVCTSLQVRRGALLSGAASRQQATARDNKGAVHGMFGSANRLESRAARLNPALPVQLSLLAACSVSWRCMPARQRPVAVR